jgi:hypothetical protein
VWLVRRGYEGRYPPRARSASLRALILSLLLSSFSSAFFRGSHTSNSVTCGFSRSYSQADQVPSSEVTCKSPRSPWINRKIVLALELPRVSPEGRFEASHCWREEVFGF